MPLLERTKLARPSAFLLLGLLFGPHLAGSLPAPYNAFSLANLADQKDLTELGLSLLLFAVGLELSPKRLLKLKKLVFGAGVLQMALGAACLAPIFCFWTNPFSATIVALAVAMSSTAICAGLISKYNKNATKTGQASFSILLAQDLAAAPLLTLVASLSSLAPASGANDTDFLLNAAPVALYTIGKTLIVCIGVFAVGFCLRPLLRLSQTKQNDEIGLAVTLLFSLGAGAAAEQFGLSASIGAFAVGLAIAETEYQHSALLLIEPIKGLLLGLFFISIGMSLDPALLANLFPSIMMLTATIMGVKLLTAFWALRLVKVKAKSSWETALFLANSGEFALAAIADAYSNSLIPAHFSQILICSCAMSMFIAPFVVSKTRYLFRDYFESPTIMPQSIPGAEAEQYNLAIVGEANELEMQIADSAKALGFKPVLLQTHSDISPLEGAPTVFIVHHRQRQTLADSVREIKTRMPQALLIALAESEDQTEQLLAAGADKCISLHLGAALLVNRVALRLIDASEDGIEKQMKSLRDRLLNQAAGKLPPDSPPDRPKDSAKP